MTTEADLIVVGGGPAGCAAAVMASSLGMHSVLIEPRALCHRLPYITSAVNVLGGFSSGRDLAARVTHDVLRAARCDIWLGSAAAAVRAAEDHVHVELDSGGFYRAPYAVVATGVRPQATTEADWISQDGEVGAPPLWKADVSELAGTTSLVLGIDRPLGTLLRTHPDLDMRLLVVYPPAERYKADEVRADPRVVLLPTTRLTLRHDPDGTLHAHTGEEHHTGEAHHTGEEHRFAGNHVYLNLGSRPVVPGGDVRTDESGYCPPGIQDPRILIAGDLRGARYQRIMTAFGSGAEAALTAYYAANELL